MQVWSAAALIFGYLFFWLKPIWEANQSDTEMAKYYQHQADFLMRDSSYCLARHHSPKRSPFYGLSFLMDWSIQFQILAIVVLAVLFCTVQR
ncbi:MAG: hypothetical protein M3Y07_04230 [Acidobacteriota bacterium]|nr:hypothetical protein [Acidobacteriota bacterium]